MFIGEANIAFVVSMWGKSYTNMKFFSNFIRINNKLGGKKTTWANYFWET